MFYIGNFGIIIWLFVGFLSGLGIESVLFGDVFIGKRFMDRVMKFLLKMNVNIFGIDNNYILFIIKFLIIKGINY